MDCGPSCLRMIAKHYGKNYSLQKLREKCSIGREGVSVLAISDAAEAIGFRTLGVKVPMDKLLSEMPLPCIAHWNQNHFVVVYKANEKTIRVADPAFGLINYSRDEFAKGWLADKTTSNASGVLLLLEPSPIFYETEDTGGEKKSSFSFLLSYLRPYRRLFGQLFLGLLLGSLLQLIFPFLTQSVVDVGINTRNINFIYLVLTGQLMLIFSRAAVDFIRRWILLHLSTRINVSIISDFLIKLMKLPIPFFSQKMIGDLLRRMEDHARIERFLSSSSLNIIFSFFNVIAFGAVLAIYSVPIFLVFFAGSAAYVVFVMLFMKQREVLDYKRFDQLSTNQTGVIQLIQGIQEIKLNNYEKLKRWEWERGQASLFKITMSSMRLQQYQEVGSLLINEVKNVTITFMAAQAVVNGSMTIGMMLASQYIVGQLTAPVNDFINFLREYQDAKISLERITEIHEVKNEESHIERLTLTAHTKGDLRIKSLSFQYDPYSPVVLDNIALQIPHGKVTAIVGASGSGKTTLLKLLLKFYAPSSGSIILGDFDLKNMKSVEWRKKCGVVMQDGFIFSDSIMRNIALSDEEIDYDKLRNAVRVANIGEFIESLPLKHQTKLGDVGIGMSQGQKQRLLIARAVYKDPEYLFFDEATSALDANNERTIIKNLDEFFKNRTVVIIAHRLSTVKNADQIIVLDKGKIAETGNHVGLTASRGSYFELVKNQLELGN
jgi:ATP-binding cassette subfamily B protein